jgi:hypothetical protein
MSASKVSGGVAHPLPKDFRSALLASPKALAAWESVTPLARNEWICWTVTVKTAETRAKHVERTITELAEGKRRPCCWMGCIHRSDKAISRSQQWVLSRQAKPK